MATVDINSRPLLSFTGRYNNANGYVQFPVITAQNAINYGGGAHLGQINNKYYLVPNMAGSNNACTNSSYRYEVTTSNYQSYLNAYGSTISWIFPSAPSESSMVAYPAELVSGNYEVDILHPEFLPFNSVCSTLTYVNIFPVYKSSIEVQDSGGSSFDDTNLISAVLMIPATMICLSCMAVIFKMFINRRVRG